MKIKGHGEPIVLALKKEINRRGDIELWENTMAMQLIVKDKVCRGAYLLNEDGILHTVSAKSVILGAGGAGQLFAQSLNPADITGDGYALAYRVGAKIVNMEFMQTGFGVIEPAKTIFNAWIWSLNPKIYDDSSHEFIKDKLPSDVAMEDCAVAHQDHYPFSSRDVSKFLEISVKRKYNEGGSVYADLRDIESRKPKGNKNLDQMWPITKAWMQHCGIDTDTMVMRIVCYAHAINGGVLIDSNSESSISGLYAVGENAGGAHGADRLGGNMFSSGQVFGEIAGIHAAKKAITNDIIEPDIPTPPSWINLSEKSDREFVDNLRNEIRLLASKYLLIIRDESGMTAFKKRMDDIETELSKCNCSTPVELMQLQECKNLVTTGKLIVNAALMRKESRGSHYREDYPDMNSDDGWRRAIVQKLDSEREQLDFVSL